jgi:short-subunit dehydrogenase
MNFKNKTVLITGASSGIGAALAQQLSTEVSNLVLVARRGQQLEQLSIRLSENNPKLKVHVFAKDITAKQSQLEIMNELINKGIQVDILINNAGIGDENLFEKSELQKLENIIELNIKSVVSLTHLFVQQFMEQPHGKGIVFIGSGGGIAWMAGSAVYSASKHFITAFAISLRAELKPYEIDVALICPGPVNTEFDINAGINNGMKGGPSQSTRISAEECATDTILGLQRGKHLIFPGKKFNRLMKLYLVLPWFVRERLLGKDAKKLYKNQ